LTSRIDAQDESPEERSFDIRPLEYCRSHRLEMIVACLTLMRGFIAAESPTINKSPLGSFEVWDARVRQCVLWLGREFAEDFGDPINCVKISKLLEPELDLLSRFLSATWLLMEDTQWTVAKLISSSSNTTYGSNDAPPEERVKISEDNDRKNDVNAILLEIAGERHDVNTKKLGHWLIAQADKRYAGLRIKRCEMKGHGGLVQWQLVKDKV
jgi:hypothetical protein